MTRYIKVGKVVRKTKPPTSLASVSIGGTHIQLAEMTAPAAGAANTVRIFAEDNGAGKTRLMAIFATGAAQQIAIEP